VRFLHYVSSAILCSAFVFYPFIPASADEVAEKPRYSNAKRNDRHVDIYEELRALRQENILLRKKIKRIDAVLRGLGANSHRSEPEERLPRFACSIETTFDGVYLGQGMTKVEALAIAVKRCRGDSKGGKLSCKSEKAVCESVRAR